MKKLNHLFPIILFFLCVSISAQDFKTIQDGIEYAEFTRGTKEEPVRINLLKLDLKKVRLDVVHALDAAIGLEKTSSIASRHGAFAAINAGFFNMEGLYKGDAAGVLKIDGKLLSESYSNRIALGILNGKDRTEIDFEHLYGNYIAGFGVDSEFTFSGINRERKDDEIILYTPEFHRTTLTNSTGIEIILSKCSNRCANSEILESKGSSVIPSDGFVISIGKDAERKSNGILTLARRKSNEILDTIGVFNTTTSILKQKQTFFENTEDIVAGVPQLIKDSKINITWQEEKIGKDFVETRHPRTAVAKLKDGKFLMVTVDGRQVGFSVGMNLNELAAFLLEIGATDAMNLDGGGSTTMFLDGKVVNKPSDKDGERSVSDAILVTLRNKK
jgi:exopolysaccharide biosynthesis protein